MDWIKRHVARLHGLDVGVSIEGNTTRELKDSVRFTIFNAIQELLLNVVKHADVRKASVVVSTHSPDCIIVTVSDEGVGFSPLIIENGDTDCFGLFTLQERVSWLEGNIDITSQPGKGCTVKIILPVDSEINSPDGPKNSPAPPLPTPEANTSSTYNVRGDGPIRVLLADNHSLLRDGLIRILLRDASFTVVGEASNGEVAVGLAAQLKPDVVLMDVMMPGIGGAEATRLIKLADPDIQV